MALTRDFTLRIRYLEFPDSEFSDSNNGRSVGVTQWFIGHSCSEILFLGQGVSGSDIGASASSGI